LQAKVNVSVVIPVCNGERFVGAALRSVLEQSFPPLETIVVDDGSTDATRSVVRQFGERVRYCYEPHRGVAAARNRGVAIARGEWIAFLDADDQWYPDKLVSQVDYLRQVPEVGMVYSDFALTNESGAIIEIDALAKQWRIDRRNPSYPEGHLVAVAFDGQPFPYPSTTLVRRDVLVKAGGFNPAFVRHEDFEAFARAARICAARFIPKSLVKRRRWALSLSSRGAPEDECYRLLLHALYDLWRDEPKRLDTVKQHLVAFYGKRGRAYLCAGDYQRARAHLDLALAYSPTNKHLLRRRRISYVPLVRSFYALWQTRVRGKELVR
jgi:glycosyltransferase involved in cell wall biosynthesis